MNTRLVVFDVAGTTVLDGDLVIDAMSEALAADGLAVDLHDEQIKVALDTGFDRTTLNVVLERLGWHTPGLVDGSVASDEVTHGRPEPHLIRRAMQLMRVDDPRSVIKVGDTPADIESGCGAVIGVSYGTHSREELEPYGPSRIIDTLPDLLPMLRAVSLS